MVTRLVQRLVKMVMVKILSRYHWYMLKESMVLMMMMIMMMMMMMMITMMMMIMIVMILVMTDMVMVTMMMILSRSLWYPLKELNWKNGEGDSLFLLFPGEFVFEFDNVILISLLAF